jgi:hypothetical protein
VAGPNGRMISLVKCPWVTTGEANDGQDAFVAPERRERPSSIPAATRQKFRRPCGRATGPGSLVVRLRHPPSPFCPATWSPLDRAIRAGGYPNDATIARSLEVRRRTVQRDAGLTDVLTFDLSHLHGSISFRTSAPPPFDPAVFRDLVGAVRSRRRVVLDY